MRLCSLYSDPPEKLKKIEPHKHSIRAGCACMQELYTRGEQMHVGLDPRVLYVGPALAAAYPVWVLVV